MFQCFSTAKTTIKVIVSKEQKLSFSYEGNVTVREKLKKQSIAIPSHPVKLSDLVTISF